MPHGYQAREEMEFAGESKETTYFDEEAAAAKEAVDGKQAVIARSSYIMYFKTHPHRAYVRWLLGLLGSAEKLPLAWRSTCSIIVGPSRPYVCIRWQ